MLDKNQNLQVMNSIIKSLSNYQKLINKQKMINEHVVHAIDEAIPIKDEDLHIYNR